MSIFDTYKSEETRRKYNNFKSIYLPCIATDEDLWINKDPYVVLRLAKPTEKDEMVRNLTVNGRPYLSYVYDEGKHDCIVNVNDVLTWYSGLVPGKKVYYSKVGGMIFYVKAMDYPLHEAIIYELVDQDMNISYGFSASVPYMIDDARHLTKVGLIKENPFESVDNDLRVGMLVMVMSYAHFLFGRNLQKSDFTGLSRLTLLDNNTLDFRLNAYDYEKMMENKEKFDHMTIREALEYDKRFGIFFRTNIKGTPVR